MTAKKTTTRTRNRLSVGEIVALIEGAARFGVVSFQYQDLSFSLASAAPSKSFSGQEAAQALIPPTHSQIDSFNEAISSTSNSDKVQSDEIDPQDDVRAKEQLAADLILTDPLAFEDLIMSGEIEQDEGTTE